MLAKKLQQAVAGAGGEALYVENVFSTYLFTGINAPLTITNGIDLATEGGMVWMKSRSYTNDHYITDTTQTTGYYLESNTTDAVADPGSGIGITGYNVDGFDFGNSIKNLNTSGGLSTSWTFRKAPKFFDVLTVTLGTSSDRSVTHNLGSTPGVIIGKKTNDTSNWVVYHRSLGKDKWLGLQTTNAATTRSNTWGSAEPTDSTFRFDEPYFGNSGDVYVFYLFAHDAGGFGDSGDESVISCGQVVGSTPTVVNLGWEPQWLMFKRVDDTGDWNIVDNMRGWTVDSGSGTANYLYANTTGSEASGGSFKPTATGFEHAGLTATYIYIAIRRGPMKTPESGTEVFAPYTIGSTPPSSYPSFVSGFPVDLGIRAYRPGGSSYYPSWSDRLRGPKYLISSSTEAEGGFGVETFDFMNGWGSVGATEEVSWMFRRAPGFFDVVCYTGDGVLGRTVSHNLTVSPELMLVKRRSTARAWAVYDSFNTATNFLILNLTDASASDSSYWNNTEPTSSVFTVGNAQAVNLLGGTFVAYLFASVPGVSKVGSYTGNGSSQTINCGFSNGSRFVLIKRTDSTGDWHVFDTARGIVSGSDPYLELNTTNAEVTSEDAVDPDSSGFVVNEVSGSNINTSSATYIYLAIA